MPIHSFLIEAGFLHYVERMKAQGAKVLFTNEGRGSRPTAGDSVNKWHKRAIEKALDTKGRKLSLHSYRATTVSKLHEVGVKGEVVRTLVGHEGVDVHEKTYLHVSLRVLKDAVERVDYRPWLKGLRPYE